MSSKSDFLTIEQLPVGWSRTSRREYLDAIALKHYNSTIERSGNGKPFLSNKSAHISISHTGNYIAFMGSAQHCCGIDIEHISRKTAHISARYATEEEEAILATLFALNPTLLIWCAKEALYKYLGIEGVDFRVDLRIISADSDTIIAMAKDREVKLRWRVVDEDLLVVHTTIGKHYDTHKDTDSLERY